MPYYLHFCYQFFVIQEVVCPRFFVYTLMFVCMCVVPVINQYNIDSHRWYCCVCILRLFLLFFLCESKRICKIENFKGHRDDQACCEKNDQTFLIISVSISNTDDCKFASIPSPAAILWDDVMNIKVPRCIRLFVTTVFMIIIINIYDTFQYTNSKD